MDIRQFLEKFLREPSTMLEGSHLFSIRGAEKAPLFYAALVKQIGELLRITPTIIDLSVHTTETHIDTLLDISFLGEASFYSLQNYSTTSNSVQKHLNVRLQSYKGPHIVIADFDAGNHILEIEEGPVIDITLYGLLFSFITNKALPDRDFSIKLFEQYKQLSLENACIVIRYHTLLGRQNELFSYGWLDRLIPSEYSLFILSQYFFSKNIQAFLAAWSRIKILYPDEFWIAFWSEQLWQATIFIEEARISSPLLARKRVSRLPYSFTNKDWQQYQLRELVLAHDFLYTIDYNLKNGAATIGLDIFYTKFLTRSFK